MNTNLEFLPFHAINEFMRPDFRLDVIRSTISNLDTLSEIDKDRINKSIKKNVKIPGFRNSDKAPALIKVIPITKAFEKKPDLVATILSSWATLQNELSHQVYDMLIHRNWKILSSESDFDMQSLIKKPFSEWGIFPIDFDRTKLPGFYPHWPKGEDFESQYKTFNDMTPEVEKSIDEVSLMTVWLTLRLPYHIDEDLNDMNEDIDRTSPAV
jgi:hypothetical protein